MNKKILMAAVYLLAQSSFGAPATMVEYDGRATITTAGGTVVTEDPYVATITAGAIAAGAPTAALIGVPGDVDTLVNEAETHYQAGDNFSGLVLVRFHDSYDTITPAQVTTDDQAQDGGVTQDLPDYVTFITMSGTENCAYVTQAQATELGTFYCQNGAMNAAWTTALLI